MALKDKIPKAESGVKTPTSKLTKEETVALWHAVRCMEDMVKAMPTVEGVKVGLIRKEQARLALAKRALRKVNALRAAGASNA